MYTFSPLMWAIGDEKLHLMTAYQFIQVKQENILNIDGCLTETANITTLEGGKLVFNYFIEGELVDSKIKE